MSWQDWGVKLVVFNERATLSCRHHTALETVRLTWGIEIIPVTVCVCVSVYIAGFVFYLWGVGWSLLGVEHHTKTELTVIAKRRPHLVSNVPRKVTRLAMILYTAQCTLIHLRTTHVTSSTLTITCLSLRRNFPFEHWLE